ncbi:methyltransferase domain-containing protein [Vibrio sp. SCSIO 43136]|uniref:class I SAM-dependent DNA methyltransferase n=1 Tax=Vibrio sp. SCSIO 43136 TaxID=2819101 RepID=UPI002074F807|nr:methyltransferase domain-containing protein [Vibrio sp. SCSIO 43136]USD67188.1 class I SAM-dependent methyltransferase [Vibrio sp. SCSIO 43136]
MKSTMYTTFASQYDEVIQDNIYNAHLDRPSLLALLEGVQGKDVLDLGCGSGVYAQLLLAQGAASMTCLDASAEMVDIVKQKLGNQATAYVQDLAKGLPQQADKSADVIISPLVLHYVQDLEALFGEIARVLKPGGYMAFSTHHPFADFECSLSGNYFEQELISEEWNTVGEPVPVTFYRRSLTEITNAITQNGLVITEMNEGKIAEEVKAIDADRYEFLSKNPNFIFIKCMKVD